MISTRIGLGRLLSFLLHIAIVALSSASIHRDGLRRRRINSINSIRGGGAYVENNPNHSYSSSASTLGDLDDRGIYRGASAPSTLQYTQHHRPPPITQAIRNYFTSLHQFSPTLFHGTTTSLLFFILWQFQSSSHAINKVLRNHFVCSRYNIMKKKRCHALFLSTFSHASFQHLAVNLYAFSTFGRSVKQTLANQGVELWPFVLSASIFASLTFLAADKGGGSCGLSGVTLALLAFDSLVYPSKELRMIISFIPIQLPAYHLFLGIVAVSIAGTFGFIGGNVAHSTHLGGLLFGRLFYEAFKRGQVRQLNFKFRKAYYSLR